KYDSPQHPRTDSRNRRVDLSFRLAVPLPNRRSESVGVAFGVSKVRGESAVTVVLEFLFRVRIKESSPCGLLDFLRYALRCCGELLHPLRRSHVPHDRVTVRPSDGPDRELTAVLAVPLVEQGIPVPILRLIVEDVGGVAPESPHAVRVKRVRHRLVYGLTRNEPSLATVAGWLLPVPEHRHQTIGESTTDQRGCVIVLRAV